MADGQRCALVCGAGLAVPAAAQLNEFCTVSVLNRNAPVNPDGTWTIPNVPAGFGRVRARATCVENGITRSGESGLFTINPNLITGFNSFIQLGSTTPIPTAVTLTTPTPTITSLGGTAQVTVTGHLHHRPQPEHHRQFRRHRLSHHQSRHRHGLQRRAGDRRLHRHRGGAGHQ